MDSITQAALGAAIGGLVLGPKYGAKALFWGAVLGTVPDLDVFIHYKNAIDRTTYHRGFSHSIIVLSFLSIPLSALIARWRRPACGAFYLWLFIWFCFVTHPLLDIFTAYGTQLLWPLPMEPLSIASISIVDPLYTLPLLGGILGFLCLKGRRRKPLIIGTSLAYGYLFLTLLLKVDVEQHMVRLLPEPMKTRALFTTPTFFNGIIWHTVWREEQKICTATLSLMDPSKLSDQHCWIQPSLSLPPLPQLQRLRWFSHGLLRLEQDQGVLYATDLRIGSFGYYPFRFAVAKQSQGQWVAINSYRKMEQRRSGKQLFQVILQQLRG